MIAASIIIPCFDQLEFTRHCLRAVFRHTRPPFELIAIDNGSTDGTGVYLAGVQDSSPAPVTIIGNARNIGFPAAVNQGLKVARSVSGALEQRRGRHGCVAGAAYWAGRDEDGFNHGRHGRGRDHESNESYE